MATEQDKTNTGVVITAFGIGIAAMLGGSAAIVSMVRTEVADRNESVSVYANHAAITEMRKEQTAKLVAGKLPIDQAKAKVLADIQRDAKAASPYTKPPAAAEASAASAAPAASGDAPAASGAAAAGASAEAPAAGSAKPE